MRKVRKISFRCDSDKIEELDALSESAHRDRSSLLNEAVANYLELQTEVHAYHAGLIQEGLEAVKQTRTMGMAETRARISTLPRSRRSTPKK